MSSRRKKFCLDAFCICARLSNQCNAWVASYMMRALGFRAYLVKCLLSFIHHLTMSYLVSNVVGTCLCMFSLPFVLNFVITNLALTAFPYSLKWVRICLSTTVAPSLYLISLYCFHVLAMKSKLDEISSFKFSRSQYLTRFCFRYYLIVIFEVENLGKPASLYCITLLALYYCSLHTLSQFWIKDGQKIEHLFSYFIEYT